MSPEDAPVNSNINRDGTELGTKRRTLKPLCERQPRRQRRGDRSHGRQRRAQRRQGVTLGYGDKVAAAGNAAIGAAPDCASALAAERARSARPSPRS
jgi:hypothetical protein